MTGPWRTMKDIVLRLPRWRCRGSGVMVLGEHQVRAILAAIERKRASGHHWGTGARHVARVMARAGLIRLPATRIMQYSARKNAQDAASRAGRRFIRRNCGVLASASAVVRGALAMGLEPRWKEANRKKLQAIKLAAQQSSEQSQASQEKN